MITSFSTPPNDRFEGSLSRRKVFITIFKPQSSAHFAKQWQSSRESYKSRNLNPSVPMTTDLNSKRLRIHEDLAKAESSLAIADPNGEDRAGRFPLQATCTHRYLACVPVRVVQANGNAYYYVLPPLYQGRGRVPSQLGITNLLA